jgi:hypothetical protein
MLPHHAQAVHNDAVEGRGFSGGEVGQRLRENGTFFEFSLCSSRACLGKIMHFIYKWRKKCRFLTWCATVASSLKICCVVISCCEHSSVGLPAMAPRIAPVLWLIVESTTRFVYFLVRLLLS